MAGPEDWTVDLLNTSQMAHPTDLACTAHVHKWWRLQYEELFDCLYGADNLKFGQISYFFNLMHSKKHYQFLSVKAKNKIFFVSPYTTDPKKMALPRFFFFMIWKLKIFLFIHQNLYCLIKGFPSLLCYFSVQFYCKILNWTLFWTNDIDLLSYFGIHYPPSRTKKIFFTDLSF